MNDVPTVQNPLLMLDYDGTLAEVVDNPDEAHPHEEVPDLLTRLNEAHPVYIVTGRTADDLSTLLHVEGLRVIGVHGMEEGVLGGEVTPSVSEEDLETLEEVRRDFPELKGLKVEDKRSAIAFHYREVSDEGREKLESWASQQPKNLSRLWGKNVLELRPEGYSKGRAVERLVKEHSDKKPVFIGDDTTDEEAFEVLALDTGLSIKVGQGETKAQARLVDVDAVVAYLKHYL